MAKVSRYAILAVLLVACGLAGLRAAESSSDAASAERIRAYVKFLSSDLLEGRGPGQRGSDLAAEYIESQFEAAGLAPAGDHGTYFQNVPMVGVKTMPETSFKLVPAKGEAVTLKNLDDFTASNESQTAVADFDAPIVFVGFGIEAPEYKWDDYKGIDLKGKVALLFVSEPASDDANFFKGKALTYYGRWTYKYEHTAQLGAVATLVIHRTDLASYGWQVPRNSMGVERSYLRLDGRTPKLKSDSWVQWDVAKKIVAMGGYDLDKLFEEAQSRNFKPIELPVHLEGHVVSQLKEFDSHNVVGKLEGTDAKLKDEAILYTAHYDHFGVDPAQKGDKIYNGAVDNATGTGILLELANEWGSSSAKPKRSIYFAAVTAEEQGLLGSEFFGKHLPIAAGKVSLDLNYDALAPIGDPEEVEVSGAERTTFYPVVQSTAKKFALTIRPDAHPEAGHYYRSDHFSLARVGIPSFSISQGNKFAGHDSDWGEKQASDYNKNNYHQPSDEFQASWTFGGLAKMTRFGFDLGLLAADASSAVQWKPGDEFEAARKR